MLWRGGAGALSSPVPPPPSRARPNPPRRRGPWAEWRTGWTPASGMSLGFSLGALIPNEVWPYQWLPLLPLVLLLVVRGIERRRFGSLAVLAVLLLGFYRAPCDLIFPNIWTV